MVIGGEADIQRMLANVMRVCLSRLSQTSVHTFLYWNDENNAACNLGDEHCHKLTRYLSLPIRKNGELWEYSEELEEVFKAHDPKISHGLVKSSRGAYFQYFQIPKQGLLLMESSRVPDLIVKQILLPLLGKLARSCHSCITHEQLIREIDARRIAERRVAHQASHDELTQLFNRRQFSKEVERALKVALREKNYGAVIFIDLNNFKSVNDAMGHHIGDLVLKEVAVRLRDVVRREDRLARFGGDEFVVLMPGLSHDVDTALDRVNTLTQRIHESLANTVHIAGASYTVGCSMGFDLYPRVNVETNLHHASDIIKNADLAMYEAKGKRQKHALAYTPSMSERLNLRLSYISELKDALLNNEFELHYQPQFNQNKQVIGAEGLLRWHNPHRGVESPQVYIPIAEDSDLIIPIGHWVLFEACRHLKELSENTLPPFFEKLSINVSAKQLVHKGFVDDVKHAIDSTGIAPKLLGIELTENTLVSQIDKTTAVINQLNDIGVSCSIDDFGTGYSSLSYLKKLPAAMIKIDRAFVCDINRDAENRSITRMIIGLGENLDMDVLAEGVETIEELYCLAEMGCNKYQGFYFSRPVSLQALIELFSLKA